MKILVFFQSILIFEPTFYEQEHMVPFLHADFNVEKHATKILQEGNISEEVIIILFHILLM